MRLPVKPSRYNVSSRNHNRIISLVVIFAIAGIGSSLLLSTHAATPTAGIEAETGALGTPAVSVKDTTASNGKAIHFQVASGGGGGGGGQVSATTPCISAAAPASWKHVVVLMFENKSYSNVINNAASPYITALAAKCGTYTAWKDADYGATGTKVGGYASKPNYATLTDGVPPSVSGITSDTYTITSSVDNIFNRLYGSGKTAKSYESGTGGSCATGNFSGSYHDPLRYYTDVGGQSSSGSTLCNQNDVPIAQFITDANNKTLPAFSIILPTNDQNTHNNSVPTGDAWAQSFVDPFLNSASYKSGDTAFFFLWDEDTPIPNVLLAPSIVKGSHPVPPGSIVFSHYSALRTWQEMLGVTPLIGDSGQAPSLLNYYDGH